MSPFTFSTLLVIILFTATALLVIYIFRKFPDSSATVNVNEGGATTTETPAANPWFLSLLKRLTFNVKGVIAGIVVMMLVESLLLYLFYDKNNNVYLAFLASQSKLAEENALYQKQVNHMAATITDLKDKLPWKISFTITKCYKGEGIEFSEAEYNQLFTLSDIAVSPYMYKPAPGQRMVIAEINEESLKEVDWTCSLISKQFGTRVFYKTDSAVKLNTTDKTISIGPIRLNTAVQNNADYKYANPKMKDRSKPLQQPDVAISQTLFSN
jgi:hypothetical protein